METIEVTENLPQSKRPEIFVLGAFDGVHLGHQHLLESARAYAEEGMDTAVCSLPSSSGLTSYQDQVRLLSELGVDRFYYCTKPVAVQELINNAQVSRLIVGKSTAAELPELEVPVTVVEDAEHQGAPITGSRIRELVEAGKMEAVQSMLGRPFELTGVVEKGEQLGRQLGFPTLNLGDINEYAEVKPAVYLGTVQVKQAYYYTLISAGYRPVVNGSSYKVEAYVMDFSGDLYDQEVSVKFLRHLRDETDFQGLDVLVEQMKKDEQYAREILGLA
ncbi:riboflavin biosynthesis protein RibF [Halobacillus litoralis]|uniref:riboflavin kinase n=1 Tax=Halobacillus litoralis TaxID=45668 RepID=UPI001CD70145|nr:riboflavin kinase [Halobacillus litoralis]MCA0972440.1 riboflavin biosynthesis protein RibF [Halobacillus litoralis]